MTSTPLTTSLEDWLHGDAEIIAQNKEALGDGWTVGATFLELHSRALETISARYGGNATPQERAILFLGIHALNLATVAMRMAVCGNFDTVPYLFRALMDCHSLIQGCSRDADLAERFLDGEEKLAGSARRKFITELQEAGYLDDAKWIEKRFLADYDAGNDLAHIGATQVRRVIEEGNGRLEPRLGGRANADEASLAWAATLEQEHWALIWLNSVVADEAWSADFAAAQRLFTPFMARVSPPTDKEDNP